MSEFVIACPHCGNQIVYDQREGAEALCPVCRKLSAKLWKPRLPPCCPSGMRSAKRGNKPAV